MKSNTMQVIQMAFPGRIMLSPVEAGGVVGMRPQMIRELVVRGKLEGKRVGKKKILIPIQALIEWVEGGGS